MRPLATVIIPCLNSAATLGKVLEGLAGQRLRDRLRVIVIDNGSTDGSLEIARPLADDITLEPRRGTWRARNRGLEMTRTGLILSLDSDCIPMNPDWAECHIDALSRSDHLVFGSAGELVPAPQSDWWAMRTDVTPRAGFTRGRPWYAAGGNACYRTEAVRQLGGFPPYAAEDAALGRLALARGLQYVWTPGAVTYHVNPVGWRAYYRQWTKIGGYVAEGQSPPSSWIPWLVADRCRHLLSSVKPMLRAQPLEAAACALKAVAITQGALRKWRGSEW